MVNKSFLIGRIGSISDPAEANGSTVLNLRLVTTERYKDGNGDLQEHPEWHDVVGWGTTAENMAQVLRVGDLVHVAGPLRTTTTKKNGTTYTNTSIRVADWQLLARPKKADPPADAAAPVDEEAAAETEEENAEA